MDTILASTRLRRDFRHELFMKTKKSMELAKWYNFISAENVFIKIDCQSRHVVPGQCTSPWVLGSVLKVIKKRFPACRIIVGDMGPGMTQNFCSWGIDRICKENDAQLISLAGMKTMKIGRFRIPVVIAEARSMLSIPVVKTHSATTISGSLKNQAGITQATGKDDIADINKMIPPDFSVADATVCMEGDGPVRGRPKIKDTIISCSSPVALDSAICHMMGINWKKVKHISLSYKKGVGDVDYRLIGDLPQDRFILPKKTARDGSGFFERQKDKLWYRFRGKKYAEGVVKSSPLYAMEFGRLIG